MAGEGHRAGGCDAWDGGASGERVAETPWLSTFPTNYIIDIIHIMNKQQEDKKRNSEISDFTHCIGTGDEG